MTGHRIMEAAATSNLKQVCLELGGKSPFIVFDDVDVDKIAPLALNACFFHQVYIVTTSSSFFFHTSDVVESCLFLFFYRLSQYS